MNEHEKNGFWIGKRAKIEIFKDNKRLIYTASILGLDNSHITFIDRMGIVYSFNRQLVTEMQQIGENND